MERQNSKRTKKEGRNSAEILEGYEDFLPEDFELEKKLKIFGNYMWVFVESLWEGKRNRLLNQLMLEKKQGFVPFIMNPKNKYII